MNIRRIKLKHIAYMFIYIHFSLSLVEKLSRRPHLQANRELKHSVCSSKWRINTQRVFKQRKDIDGIMTFTTPNYIGESHVFYDVKFDHVLSRDNVVHGTMNRISVL